MNREKHSQVSLPDYEAPAESIHYKEVGSGAMFENRIDSRSSNHSKTDDAAVDMTSHGVESILGTQKLGGLVGSSEEESDDEGSPPNTKMVMKISVSNKILDKVIVTHNFPKQNPDKELEQIHDKLCQSPLNQVFSPENIVSLQSEVDGYTLKGVENHVKSYNEQENVQMLKLTEEADHDSIINPLDNQQELTMQEQMELMNQSDWKPVACKQIKQTQQFLESQDQTQKSEYKHFQGNILRNKKQIIAQNQKRQRSRQRNRSHIRTEQPIVELSSSLMKVDGFKCLKSKELEFEPLKLSSTRVQSPQANKDAVNSVSNKFSSKVTFNDGSIKKYQPHESISMNKLKKPVLLNSNSELKQLELIHASSTALTNNLNAQSNDYVHHLTPRLSPINNISPIMSQKGAGIMKGIQPLRQNNSSQINVEPAMFDDSRRGDDKDESVSNQNGQLTYYNQSISTRLQQIKVPNVPKNENDVDYLTETSDKQQIQTGSGMAMINFDYPNKIMNKTAFIRDTPSKSPDIMLKHAPFGGGAFTPPPSQGISEFMKVVAVRTNPPTHAMPGSHRGLSPDLLSVVQQSKQSAPPQESMSQSPLLPDQWDKILPKLQFDKTELQASGLTSSEQRQKSVQITTLRKESQLEDMQSTFGPNIKGGFTRKETTQDKNEGSAVDVIVNIDDFNKNQTFKDKKKPPQLSLKSKVAKKPSKTTTQLALRNEFVLSSKDENVLKSPPPQEEQKLLIQQNDSIVVKSIAVTHSGKQLNMIGVLGGVLEGVPGGVLVPSNDKKMTKYEAMTNAKKRALDERLQNVLQFSNEIESVMNVQPAPIKSRLTQMGDGGSPLGLRLNSPMTNEGPDGPPYIILSSKELAFSQEATIDDVSSSPIKITQQTSPLAGKYINSMQGVLGNIELTITIERDTAKDISEVTTPKTPIVKKSPNKPVKVRLFDIGGIGDPRSHAIILQNSPRQNPIQSPTKGPHETSIYQYEERDRLNPSKVSSNITQLKTKKKPESKVVAGTPSITKSKGQGKDLVQIVSKVVENNYSMGRNTTELDQQQPLQLMLSNRINTSLIREKTHTSSAASRNCSKHGSSITPINKLSKTSYHLYKQMSSSSQRQSGLKVDYSSSVSPMKHVIKNTEKSEDLIMLDTHSNDTKYFNKSKRQSMNEDYNMNMQSLHDSARSEKSPMQQISQNIKVVELSHIPQVNSDFIDYPGQSIMTHEENQTMQQTHVDQMQKYFRLTSFIGEMFKKKDTSNPIQSKNRSQPRMKKHTGWNKILMGVKSNNTPAISRFEPINNRYLSPAKIQAVETRLQQHGVRERKSQVFNSQPKSPTNRHPFINQTFRNIQPRSPVKTVKEPDFLKSNSARLHPFYHSLVTQNFDKLKQKLKAEEQEFMLLAVHADNLFPKPKLVNTGTQAMHPEPFLNDELRDSVGDHGMTTQLLANSRTSQPSRNNGLGSSFQIRSQLSPINQRPNQVSNLRNYHSKIGLTGPISGTTSQNTMRISQHMLMQSSLQQNMVAESPLHIQQNVTAQVFAADDEQQLVIHGENQGIRVSSQGSKKSIQLIVASQTSGKVSPLMDKSRQQKQGNTTDQIIPDYQKSVRQHDTHIATQSNKTNSMVYRQLSKGAQAANSKVWSVVKKHNESSQRHSSLMIGRNISPIPDDMNIDLVKDGATLTKNNKDCQHEIDAINASSRFREMRLPPVKVKTAIDCKCSRENLQHGVDADRDSPMLDSIFPVLSPSQQNYHQASSIVAGEGMTGFKTAKAPKQFVFTGKSRVQQHQKALTSSNINTHKKKQIA